MTQTSDIFSKLAAANISERGNYIKPGTYDLKIKNVSIIRTRGKGDAFIVHFVVAQNYGSENHKVGEEVDWYRSLLDTDYAAPEMKAFFVAALGYDYKTQKKEVDEKISPQLQALAKNATEEGGLNGELIHCSAFETLAKALKPGQTELAKYTKLTWAPYKGAK